MWPNMAVKRDAQNAASRRLGRPLPLRYAHI